MEHESHRGPTGMPALTTDPTDRRSTGGSRSGSVARANSAPNRSRTPSPYSLGPGQIPNGGAPTRESAEVTAMQLEEYQHGPPEVMIPRITHAAHGTEDELMRAQTVTMAHGPGFQLRQAS